jgi:hypothetical protein
MSSAPFSNRPADQLIDIIDNPAARDGHSSTM